jgi:hypothetical protein
MAERLHRRAHGSHMQGKPTRVTLLCSITAPPPAYSNRQRHPAFTVAIHDQPRTKSTRAAVSTSARTEHRYLKPASRDTNFHKPPQPITSQALRVPHSPCVKKPAIMRSAWTYPSEEGLENRSYLLCFKTGIATVSSWRPWVHSALRTLV